ncbi:MAG: Ldh family oxidoreductase [Candidatus Cloacimonetes bacterium]|nr:Ldh family oxidoreductase [Candidatus Cloacimonadota bacterium]MDD4688016.1 Ldh family oxidoreductase [Candidatus Cloacimonadota bacterium]
MMYQPVEAMHDFMIKVFVGIGVPLDDAKICADVLIASDLRGIESHGIGRLKMYYDRIKQGIQNPITKIDIIRDKYATAVWDGNHGMGHVIAHRAMQMAIEKAKLYGLGCVTVRNSTHYGICGYYANMATKNDMIGLTVTNARPSICPTHGVQPLLGTNPICFGAPTNLPYPFIYDAATSISQRGKVEQYSREGKQTPPYWAINLNGEPQTDTQKLLVDLVEQTACMLPLGGTEEVTGSHKGYGLSTMVEILSAALQKGSYLNGLWGKDENGKAAPYRLGHFFLAINIDFFTEIEDFKRISTDICVQLQNSKKLPGRERIWVAGEKEYEKELAVRKNGIPIIPNLAKNIQVIQDELKLKILDI